MDEQPKEPASRQDVNDARDAIIKHLDKQTKSVEDMRSQNSAEHGALYSLMHSALAGISWIKASWRRFSILPVDPTPGKTPPSGKDDTQ